jgi:integrase/recombinase XerD
VNEFVPCLVRCHRGSELESITLGHPLLDDYLAFVAVRARTNTWLAVASDLKIFFGVVAKEPTQVTPADVLAFLATQRAPRRGARVVRLRASSNRTVVAFWNDAVKRSGTAIGSGIR